MMTDYLAEIAAMTVECPKCNGVTGWGCDCKDDAGRVLDPRFDGLREMHDKGHANYDGEVYTGQNQCSAVDCPGYSVNRNLEALLACVNLEDFTTFTLYKYRKDWVCSILFEGNEVDLTRIEIQTNAPLEAASQAFHEYLLQEQKVTS